MRVHEYERGLYGECAACGLPAENRRWHGTVAATEAPQEMAGDVDRIEAAIQRCLASGRDFSANDMQHVLATVQNKKLIGKVFGRFRAGRLIQHTGRYEPSSNPKAKGHDVKVYRPGPNYNPLKAGI